MKKSAAPILILVFLLVAVGIFVVFRISKNNASDTQNPGTTATATPEPTATTPPRRRRSRPGHLFRQPSRPLFLQQRPS